MTDYRPDNPLADTAKHERVSESEAVVTPKTPDQTAKSRDEALRVGLEDQSEMAGATVDAEHDHMAAGDPPTAGDPDAMSEQAKVVGEEAIGGTTPLPDQNVVDDVGDSVGVDVPLEHPVNVTRSMQKRDQHRWELDPESEDRPLDTEPLD